MRFLLLATNHATRWLFLSLHDDQRVASGTDLVRRLSATASMKMDKLLTDNVSQFTGRFTCEDKKQSGRRTFDGERALLQIGDWLTKLRHPQTNGMVEHFNHGVSDSLSVRRLRLRGDLETTLERCSKFCNEHLPLRGTGHNRPLPPMRFSANPFKIYS